MGRRLSFEVAPEEAGLPLREFLRRRGVSASLIKAVKYRGVGFWADGRAVFTDYLVRAGETVMFELPPERDTSVPPQDLPLAVVYEDEDAVLLEKPAGMAVHPTLTIKEGTLANAWMGLLQKRGEEGVFRPLNRLDKDTSGLVLCAKNAYAAPLLSGGCRKVYWALARGEMPLGEGVVDAPIGRAEGSIIARRVCAQGKPSRTEYRVLAAMGGYSLVEVRPCTGRTHQIRVHLAWVGYPLAGDRLYGDGLGMDRHALHCGRVCFKRPDGGDVAVESPLPPDMVKLAKSAGLL